jgi:hypothetical protein
MIFFFERCLTTLSMSDEGLMEHWWNDERKTEVLGEKPVPLPLCSPQIPRGLALYRGLASGMTDR